MTAVEQRAACLGVRTFKAQGRPLNIARKTTAKPPLPHALNTWRESTGSRSCSNSAWALAPEGASADAAVIAAAQWASQRQRCGIIMEGRSRGGESRARRAGTWGGVRWPGGGGPQGVQ